MELEFKPDFDAAREQWDRFWRRENSRPAVSAVIPNPGVEPVEKPPYTAGHDGDFGPVIDQVLRWAETHEFLGAAIPFYYLEFTAAHFAALLGADICYGDAHGNGWIVPFVDDWDDVELRFRPECKWWGRTAAFARALMDRCAGRLLIASPTLVANVDALSAVRGPQGLLMDLIDRPDAVRRALQQVDRAHAEILDALAELLDYETWGSINRHGLYSRGRINVPQCDFSAMIGPDMFREFVLPALRSEMARLDAVEYHLDGPDAIVHLEALAEIDDLDVVQWVPGSGEAEDRDWSDLYRRIDRLGKGQYRGGPPEKLHRWWDELESRTLVWKLSVRTRGDFDECMSRIEERPVGGSS